MALEQLIKTNTWMEMNSLHGILVEWRRLWQALQVVVKRLVVVRLDSGFGREWRWWWRLWQL